MDDTPTKRMTDERLKKHVAFAATVKQSCAIWHRQRGCELGTLASDNTYDLGCRVLECVTEIRRLRAENAKVCARDRQIIADAREARERQ